VVVICIFFALRPLQTLRAAKGSPSRATGLGEFSYLGDFLLMGIVWKLRNLAKILATFSAQKYEVPMC
jgi:hypothetical protein